MKRHEWHLTPGIRTTDMITYWKRRYVAMATDHLSIALGLLSLVALEVLRRLFGEVSKVSQEKVNRIRTDNLTERK